MNIDIEKPSFKQLVLLNMQQLTNFPYIEKDFDAITDYQLLCKVVDYLNDIIKNQNTTNDTVLGLYNAFTELQNYINNYFDNLDVQEEINNKLDEMAGDGTLEHIIASYLQTQKIYNTHEDMIADADNLVDGLNVQTLGYYSVNDGGGAFYKITENESISEYQETVGKFYATLIKDVYVTPEMFGAYGDNTHDDKNAFQTAINNFDIIQLNKKTYKISDALDIQKDILIKGNNGKIFTPSFDATTDPDKRSYRPLFSVKNNATLKIQNINFESTNDQIPGIYYSASETTDYRLSNVYAISTLIGNAYIDKCSFKNIDCVQATLGNATIKNCTANGCGMFGYINRGQLRSLNNVINMAETDSYYHTYYINLNGNLYSESNYITTERIYDIYHPYTSDSHPILYANNDICKGKFKTILQAKDGEAYFDNCSFIDTFTSENISNYENTLFELTNMTINFNNCIIDRYLNKIASTSSSIISFNNSKISTRNSFANWLGNIGVYNNCELSTVGTFAGVSYTSTFLNCYIKCNILATSSSSAPNTKYINCLIEKISDGSSPYAISFADASNLVAINNTFKNYDRILNTEITTSASNYKNNNLLT